MFCKISLIGRQTLTKMLSLKKNLSLFRHFSTLSTKKPKSNPLADYLVSKCGLTSNKAAIACGELPRYTSIEQAHSVRHFLEHLGFDAPRISKAFFRLPQLIGSDVVQTLQPNLEILRGLGFSEPELKLVVKTYPRLLINPFTIPSLQFWRNFDGGGGGRRKDRGPLTDLSSNRSINILSGIAPKVAILKDARCSDIDIFNIVKRACCFVALMPVGHGRLSLDRVEWAAFDAKVEFFKGLGWSEAHFLSALVEDTDIIHLSEEDVTEKMKVLVERGGCDRSYIFYHPSLLTLNMERTLKPRCYVMGLLQANPLLIEKRDLLTIMKMPQKEFVRSYIRRYKKLLPQKLQDSYFGS